jgi:DNA polymerase III delta prime subunit
MRSKASVETENLLPLAPELLSSHHDTVSNALRNWKQQDRVPPVLLLSGPPGIGKREIAYYIAQTLLCENAGFTQTETIGMFGSMGTQTPTDEAPTPCGTCSSCERALNGNFLDFKEIQTEKDSQTLKIDQFREIKESQGYSSFSGSYRVFLINESERLTTQAANSLLKILEEPPQGWVFLLTVTDSSLLPTTIVSRCQALRLKPLPLATVKKLLEAKKTPLDRLDTCVQLSFGSLKRALAIADDEAWEKRSQIFIFIEKPHSILSSLVDWAASDHSNLRLLLDQFEQILLDLIHASQSRDINPYTWANLDGKNVLLRHYQMMVQKKGSPSQASLFWLSRAERLFAMRREMTAPLNLKILTQDFLIPWLDP